MCRPAGAAEPGPVNETATRHAPWTVFRLAATVQFMVILDTGIVTIALPSIRRSLGFSAADLPWVMDAYMLVLGGLVLVGGRAADLMGRRTALLIGLGAFTLASAACALAPEAWTLVAARVAQGAGAALAAPAALALITDTFPPGPDRNRAMGIFGGIGGVAGPTGVLLGGALSAVSWQLIFLINLPICLVLMVLLLRMVPRASGRAGGRTDLTGALSVTTGLCLVVYALTRGATSGWDEAPTLVALCGGGALLAAFITRQLTARDPLVPRSLFATPEIMLGCAIFLLLGAALYGTFVTNALYLQTDRHYTPIVAAAVMVPLDLALLAGSQIAGRLLGRYRPAIVLTAGLITQSAGLAWLAATLDPQANLAVSFLLPGVVACAGLGAAIVGAFVCFTSAATGEIAGAASGLTMMTNQVGGAIGIAATATLLAGGFGTATALGSMAVFALVGALLALVLHRKTLASA
jgi:EmrB/QacA subfamily drug resistance transporter